MTPAISVLFVCLGNICRSPTAEGVFRRQVEAAGLADVVHIDSAGTGDWHVGKAPDQRMQAAALARGYDLSALRARQLSSQDLQDFDYLLVMDHQNARDAKALAKSSKASDKVQLLLSYAPGGHEEVPDPYFGGESGFYEVIDLVEVACEQLLAQLRTTHAL